jgi:hypothetical protein
MEKDYGLMILEIPDEPLEVQADMMEGRPAQGALQMLG